MKDLQRKVDKFIKQRAASKGQKSRGVSPVITSAFSPNATGGFYSTAQSTTKIVKKVNNRTFSMTVSFNPRFDLPKSKDIAIYHQNSKQKNLMAKTLDFTKSPKRNPILQDGQEPCFEFKAPFKATPLSNKMTIFTEEPAIKKRAHGECKDIDQARSLSPRAPCIKTFYQKASGDDQSPENPRRIRKGAAASLKNLFNPIVDGDIENLKFRRVRKGPVTIQPSEETVKLNDRNGLLATDIGFSPKGRVFRDTSLTLAAHSTEDPAPVKGRRYGSPELRKQPDMQGLLNYSYSLPFRQDAVSPKCTAKSFYDVVQGMSNSKMF